MTFTLADTLTDLLAAVSQPLDPVPQRIILQPGAQVAWDNCECGQLWVRIISVKPMYGKGRSPATCGPLAWDVQIAVGILRCAATLQDDGEPPTADDVTADALQMLADYEALRSVLTDPATVEGLRNALGMQAVQWNPLGPEGACAGGEWTATLRVNNCG